MMCVLYTLRLAKRHIFASLDKEMLNGEEIKPIALYLLSSYAWLESSVSQSVSIGYICVMCIYL